MRAMDCCRGARLAGSASVADQAWALLLQVGFELVSAHFAAAVAEVDLAPAQARALHELDLERPISMRELAERLKSDPSNVTGLIDRLEARGLVQRSASAEDRRVRLVTLTPAGEALLDAIEPDMAKAQERILAPLPAAERTEFMRMLRALVSANNELSRAPSES